MLVPALVLLNACTTSRYKMSQDKAPEGYFDFSKVPDAVPKWEPMSPGGNKTPYRVNGKTYHLLPNAHGYVEEGLASWYGLKFHGELTSNGETYNMYEMSAAHKSLPLPTYLKVTNLENGKTVVVRVNDRGPFHSERIIDLSFAAANRLGFADKGTAKVRLESITPAPPTPAIKPKSTKATPQKERVETPVPASAKAAKEKLAPFVQVAAYSNRQAAERLKKQLTERLGMDKVFVATSALGDRPVYRVRLGPYQNEVEATAVRQRIEAENIGEPIVITRSVLAREQ